MRIQDIYGGSAASAEPVQATAPGVTPSRDTQQAPAKAAPMSGATTVSWIGIVVALVLLRVVYEVAE